jgi:PPOX class probable F420-dependent enzyme
VKDVAAAMTDDALLSLLASRHQGVLATLKGDGRPQLSNVVYAYDESARLIRVSVTDDLAKTRNLRRDPRASLHVTTEKFWPYVVAEGGAELSPVATHPGDPTVDELVELYRAIKGEHPDWDEYRAAMAAERRLVLRLSVDRVYGIRG